MKKMNGMSEKSETKLYSLSRKLTHSETTIADSVFPRFQYSGHYYSHISFSNISSPICDIVLVNLENGQKCVF